MTLCLDRPRLYVDFNEMPAKNVVLLSQTDNRADSDGNIIELSEGLAVYIYENDLDIDGRVDFLVAKGTCRRNRQKGWGSVAKWVCEIDDAGIRHLSEFQ